MDLVVLSSNYYFSEPAGYGFGSCFLDFYRHPDLFTPNWWYRCWYSSNYDGVATIGSAEQFLGVHILQLFGASCQHQVCGVGLPRAMVI